MARNKKNGTDLYLVCSFTFKLPAVVSKFFLRYRGEIFLQFPVTSGRRKNSKIFRALPGIQYIFALHHVNKPGKFQRGIINPHLFTVICFRGTQRQFSGKFQAISCLPASPRIFEHLQNDKITHF